MSGLGRRAWRASDGPTNTHTQRVISFSTVLQAVLPIYLLALLGMFLRRTGALTPQTDAGLFRVIVHCLFPCLILDKTLSNELVRQPSVVLSGIGVGFGMVVTGFFVAWLVGRLIGLENGSGRRTFTLTAGLQNYGFTAIPLLMTLFVGDRTLGVLFVHGLGVELALWGVGIVVLTGGVTRDSLRFLLNGPIVAVVVGLLLAYTGGWKLFEPGAGGGPLLGQIVRQVIGWLGAAAFPVALVLIGAPMLDFAKAERFSVKVGIGGILVRCVVMPVLMLWAASFLPLVLELKQVLLVQAAMPSAVSPVILARQYGGRPAVAFQVIVATSVAALVTMPLIVTLGMTFLGLDVP